MKNFNKKDLIFYCKQIFFLLFLISLLSCQKKSQSQIEIQEINYSSPKRMDNAFPISTPFSLGAYYYPEQWPEKDWHSDLKRMSELGFTFTHFGEFAWALMEPQEGQFHFEWLDKAIEIAAKYNLKVVLCTPSPTPPAWLSEKHSEILVKDINGRVMEHGSRQHASWSSDVYRKYCERIIEQLAKRYGSDERVIGWQLDNEPSHYSVVYDYSEASKQKFQQWLFEKYKNINQLNQSWGNSFWSQNYNTFKQICIPNPKALVQPVNPHALLDFQLFQNNELKKFLHGQTAVLRKYISEQQFVTTNYMMQIPFYDPFVTKNTIDFSSYTMYPVNSYSATDHGPLGFRLGAGKDLSFAQEFFRSIHGRTGIMELQPGQVNWGQYNSQPQPGAVRMWLWHAWSLNADFVCTYRFKQPLFGNEQYHSGIIGTDGKTLSRGGQEFVKVIAEMNDLQSARKIANVDPEYKNRKTAILWDHKSSLDIMNYPHTQSFHPVEHLHSYYKTIKSFGAPVVFVTSVREADSLGCNFLLIPAKQLINTSEVEEWTRYVNNGGNLILTCRTGQKDVNGHLWDKALQEPLYQLLDGQIEFNDHMPFDKKAKVRFENSSYDWQNWGEVIDLNKKSESKAIAVYDDQFYKGKAAALNRKIGKGTLTYIGVSTIDKIVEQKIIENVYKSAGVEVLNLPPNIFIENRDGLWVAVNYSSESFLLPVTQFDKIILGDILLLPGEVTVWQKK